MAKRKNLIPIITNKEKSAPAYRKKVELENMQLKTSLEITQNQSSILQQKCSDLEKENSVLTERQRGIGLQVTIKDICFTLGGAGLVYYIEGNYYSASKYLIITFIFIGFYWILSNFRKKIK